MFKNMMINILYCKSTYRIHRHFEFLIDHSEYFTKRFKCPQSHVSFSHWNLMHDRKGFKSLSIYRFGIFFQKLIEFTIESQRYQVIKSL